jgi:hypothetical protein
MKFPGSRLLHQWDLSVHRLSLDDLVRSCRETGLTGLAEVRLPGAVGLIFYYAGVEVNAHYREGSVAISGRSALERLQAKVGGPVGTILVFELPLDMAHLLRGITKRQPIDDQVKSAADLDELLRRLQAAEHTGTLEIQNRKGAAMILFVRGRASNFYWETAGGVTFEKGEARQKLEEALPTGGEAKLFLADFSREVWKSRHEVTIPVQSRLESRPNAVPVEQIAREEAALREQVLNELVAEVPSVLHAFIFDLMTGAVYVRWGRGGAEVKVRALAEQVPGLVIDLRDRTVWTDDDEGLEFLEIQTPKVSILIGIVPEAQEGVCVLGDRSQPTVLLEAALSQTVRNYAARLHPSRRKVSA